MIDVLAPGRRPSLGILDPPKETPAAGDNVIVLTRALVTRMRRKG